MTTASEEDEEERSGDNFGAGCGLQDAVLLAFDACRDAGDVLERAVAAREEATAAVAAAAGRLDVVVVVIAEDAADDESQACIVSLSSRPSLSVCDVLARACLRERRARAIEASLSSFCSKSRKRERERKWCRKQSLREREFFFLRKFPLEVFEKTPLFLFFFTTPAFPFFCLVQPKQSWYGFLRAVALSFESSLRP